MKHQEPYLLLKDSVYMILMNETFQNYGLRQEIEDCKIFDTYLNLKIRSNILRIIVGENLEHFSCQYFFEILFDTKVRNWLNPQAP